MCESGERVRVGTDQRDRGEGQSVLSRATVVPNSAEFSPVELTSIYMEPYVPYMYMYIIQYAKCRKRDRVKRENLKREVYKRKEKV